MNRSELQAYLYQQIPLSKAMGIELIEAGVERVELTAPLGFNSNHMDTAFGGSLATALILACYAYLFNRLDEFGFHCHVLIKESSINYLSPVREDLKAICMRPADDVFNQFLRTFERRGRARIVLSGFVETANHKACVFSGEFVAVKAER